jgi:hypothetical protein
LSFLWPAAGTVTTSRLQVRFDQAPLLHGQFVSQRGPSRLRCHGVVRRPHRSAEIGFNGLSEYDDLDRSTFFGTDSRECGCARQRTESPISLADAPPEAERESMRAGYSR